MIGRSQVHLAATVSVLVFGACSAPAANTDLRTGGSPQVLAVLIADDPNNAGFIETATFCKLNDDKRPGLIPASFVPGLTNAPLQVCPDDLSMEVSEVTDTNPIGWYVRLEFDELLNTKVEDLEPILDNGQPSGLSAGTLKNTQPVVVTCNGADVPYDGYYDPSGNAFSWPVGPCLFIQPLDTSTVATGSDCTVAIKEDVVVSKTGAKVPTGQIGPYMFKIAPLTLLAVNPEAPADITKVTTVDPMAPATITFNATIDVASLSPASVHIVEAADCASGATGIARTAALALDMDGQSIDISDMAATGGNAFEPGKTYIITFAANTPVADLAGGPGTVVDSDGNSPVLCFQTATP